MRFIRSFKLEDLCLQVIVNNLDLFIYSKFVPQKYIDFLLRVYSKEVFHQYSKWNTITEVCMSWFLNSHCRNIKLSTITPTVIDKLQDVGPVITSLNLHESLATENILNVIVCCVPNVTCLDLSSTSCNDKTLLCVQRMCPNLVTLNLKGCKGVTDKGMKYLCMNKSLKVLDIANTAVWVEGLECILEGIPSLQIIKYENFGDMFYQIHEQKLFNGTYKEIPYNLVEFIYEDIDYCSEPIEVICLWTILCPNIKRVHLKFPISRKVFDVCTRFQNLEEIKVNILSNNILDVHNDLSSHITTKLTTLCLSDIEIPNLTFIETFKHLKCLYLLDVYFTNILEEKIKTTETRLDTLVIRGVNFESQSSTTYKAIALLISLSKNVTRLYLNYLNILPQDIFHIILNSMKNLSFVDLSYSNVTLDSVIPLFRIPSLRVLYLDLWKSVSLDEYPALKSSLANNSTTSTLSWCIMDDDCDDSDNDILSWT